MLDCHQDSSSAKSVVSAFGDDAESDSETVSTGDGEDMAAKLNCHDGLNTEDNGAIADLKNVSVVNSSDVHFGNKTFYNGPVTIKQFVYSSKNGVHTTLDTDSCCADKRNSEKLLNVSPDSSEPVFTDLNPAAMCHVDMKDNVVERVNCQSSLAKEGLKQSDNEERFLKQFFRMRNQQLNCFLIAIAILLVTILLIILTILVVRRENVVPSGPRPDVTMKELPSDVNVTLSGKLQFMQRVDWVAQPPTSELDKLQLPVPYVIISHTASEGCSKIAKCVLLVRKIQSYHVDSRDWSDIGYNFLVGGDGLVYIGRGWDYVGAHTYGYNYNSIGISMIGTFIDVLPTEGQQLAAQQLIELGVKLGKIAPDYKLLGHRQVIATESPGTAFFRELQKWPHWSPTT